MLKLFVSVLQSSLMIAFVVAVALAWLEAYRSRQLLQAVKRGLVLTLAASVGLAYGMETVLLREPAEGIISLLAVLSAIALTAGGILRREGAINSPEDRRSQIISPLVPGLITLTLAVLVLPLGLDVALSISKLFKGDTGLISTEMAVRLVAALSVLALSSLLAVTLRRVISQVRRAWFKGMAVIVLMLLLVQEATTVLQIGLARGIIPLADWLFRPAVVLINNYSSFYYGLLTVIGAAILLAFWERRHHQDDQEGLNPAQSRKLKAGRRRMATLTTAAAAILGLAVFVDGVTALYANRPLQLSPATPVMAQNGMVAITRTSLGDGQLHRFSYEMPDGIAIRFLAIYKGSGVYGVGLDACEFCGVAGYRQDRENVICNRCEAAINAITIGFPGGCNPIPLDIYQNEDSLVVSVKTLESVKGVFAR